MKTFSVFLVVTLLTSPAWGAGSVDAGRIVFNSNCQNCHSDPPTAALFIPARFNPGFLTSAFQSISAMSGYLALDTQTINDIATYLGLPNGNDTERLLDWGEDTFPQILSPTRQSTQQFSGYSYRFYPNTGVYVGIKDASVWFYDSMVPGAAILNLGTLRSYLDQMPSGH